MSVLLKKILWFRVNEPDIAINISDSVDLNVGRGIDIKNNIALITLKNSGQSFDSAGDINHKYIDENKVIKFEEQDQIKIYLKYTDDMVDVESLAWNNNSFKHSGNITEEPLSDYLKGVYYVIEFNVQENIKGSPIKLKSADKCYILFNRLLARAFTDTDSLITPQAVQKVVRFSSQNQKGDFFGTGDDSGVLYDIDAKLVSEGGYVQDTRKSTTEEGGVNSDTTFPTAVLAKVWKPVYEWINELSQIEFLNTSNELTGVSGVVYGRPFLYFVDELNRFHWFETDNAVDETIIIGTTTGIYDYKLDKKVFDTINFIIYRGGKNLYGKGTLNYYVEETSNVKTKKMRVIAMTDIAQKLIKQEVDAGNLILDNAQTVFTYEGNNYKSDAYGFTTVWGIDTTGFDDDDYNDTLETEIFRLCELRARSLVKGLAHARYKGTINRKGSIVIVGSLLNVTNKDTGQDAELLRVMDIRDTINKTGWFTNMQIEQDQKAIIEIG
ncbi:hypothetical protein LCGC14_1229500 [marine sediment metagenome]|uniref:Prophage tail endopeptidase domain-containing protein n=1 Tax=marine sediment metagenome TaxID=412755 RepID=A0A0F9L8X3_9ZZZZ